MLTKTDRGPCIYVIAASPDGPCKIGHARNARSRLSGIQIGNHLELKLWSCWHSMALHQREIERAIHAALVAYHIRGEWFDVTAAEAVQVIEAIDDFELRNVKLAISGAPRVWPAV